MPVTKQPPIRPSPPETKPKKPETPSTVFSKEKAKQVVQHLQAARDALKQDGFPLAEQQVAAAQKLNPTEKYAGPIERLKLIRAYAKQFQTRFRESVSEFKPGSELRILTATGEKICAVVEVTPQMIVLRVDGQNQRYGFNGLKPAIAIAMVHTVVKTDDSITKVIDAAFLATRKNPTSRERMLAQELFKQARSLGADIGMLELFLQDDYERLINP